MYKSSSGERCGQWASCSTADDKNPDKTISFVKKDDRCTLSYYILVSRYQKISQ